MNAFLTSALLSVLLLPITANAVYVSDSGFGEALIYPYYTVRSTEGNAFNTYVSIANGDTAAKALRVRFREGRNGREVAGFNLFLGPRAIWAGAIVPSGAGARLVSPDPACLSPALSDAGSGGAPFLEFTAAAFSGANADTFGQTVDRVREGYVEVLEMGALSGALPACADLRAERVPAWLAPRGYLYGTTTLINVNSGLAFTADAEALANLATAAYYRPPSDPYPDFDAAEIGNVASFERNDKLYRIAMPTGLGAVEAAMVRAWIDNEVVLDAATLSATDWVLTMPTRRFYRAGRVSPWFADSDAYNAQLRDQPDVVRLSGQYTSRGMGAALITTSAPWAVTVFGFRPPHYDPLCNPFNGCWPAEVPTGALGSLNGSGIPTSTDGGGAAHLQFPFNPDRLIFAFTTQLADGAVGTEPIRLKGLPVVGFMARTFRNGTLQCGAVTCQGNYGSSAAHRFKRVVDPTSADP